MRNETPQNGQESAPDAILGFLKTIIAAELAGNLLP